MPGPVDPFDASIAVVHTMCQMLFKRQILRSMKNNKYGVRKCRKEPLHADSTHLGQGICRLFDGFVEGPAFTTEFQRDFHFFGFAVASQRHGCGKGRRTLF